MDTTFDGHARSPSAASRPPGRLAALRSAAVVMGPSLLLIAGAMAALLATLLFALTPATPARLAAALGTAAAAIFVFILRPWYLRWGATDDEIARVLPGDSILPRPAAETTRAVTIAAPAREVWPWLLQLGQGRGGLYSYDWLENLAGLDIHSAGRIIPELQRLEVGDPVPLGPGPHNGYVVAAIEPGRALVLRLDAPGRGGPVDHDGQKRWADLTYTFVLEPLGSNRTRLLLRFRLDGRPRGALRWLYTLLIEFPHFVMERKTLLGIRRRAERAHLGDLPFADS